MVEGDKPPKNKGVSSGSEENNIDQYDPLYLHSNDTNGVSIIGFKLESTENYKVWKAAISIEIHTKNKLGFINGKIKRPQEAVFSKNAKTVWDELEETYSKQDASVIFNMHFMIHSLARSGAPLSEYYHKFNALWRQYDSLFLMGLDEVYAPIRSIILTTDPIPDVKGAFATLSRDESHRSTHSHYVIKFGNGNTAFVARPNNRSNNWSGSNNQPRRLNRSNLVCTHYNMNGHTADRCFELVRYPSNFQNNVGTNRGSASNNVVSRNKDHYNTFTDDQYKRLMSLISEKSGSSRFYSKDSSGDWDEVGHPDKRISEEAACENLEIKILDDNINRQSAIIRRSTRKTSMPAKLSDFEVDTKVKYNIDRHVNYSKLSEENYNFSTNLNRISEPKTYNEAANDIRWIEAMNQEMEALNRNGTWVITNLPIGRKPIGGFPAQSVRSSNAYALDSPYLLVLNTGTSQSRQHDMSE
nr:hypothetical protein [Tanacetum cinerariifolium]